MTLLDYPGKMACTAFTGGCNLRCPFCHNASLVIRKEDPTVSENDFLAYLSKRRSVLEGVVITGGEPLLHPDLDDFLRNIKAMGYPIKLDTNGTLPQHLKTVVNEGLVDRVAMDIKNEPASYAKTVGLDNFSVDAVQESIDFLLSGHVEYEFRTTVVKGIHTKEGLIRLAEWIAGAEEYYLQQFKDSGDLIAPQGLEAFSPEEMQQFANAVRPFVPSVAVRGL